MDFFPFGEFTALDPLLELGNGHKKIIPSVDLSRPWLPGRGGNRVEQTGYSFPQIRQEGGFARAGRSGKDKDFSLNRGRHEWCGRALYSRTLDIFFQSGESDFNISSLSVCFFCFFCFNNPSSNKHI